MAASAVSASSAPAINRISSLRAPRSLLWSFMAHTVTLRVVKKIVKPALIAVGVLLPGAILLAAEDARFGGMFHSFTAGFPGTCTEMPLAGSSGHVQVDGRRGIAYLSVLDRASLARSEPVSGTIMLVDPNVPEPAARAAMASDPPDFRPHGLSLFDHKVLICKTNP